MRQQSGGKGKYLLKCKDELENSINKTREALGKHPAAFPELLLTSATKRNGIDTLRATIANIQ